MYVVTLYFIAPYVVLLYNIALYALYVIALYRIARYVDTLCCIELYVFTVYDILQGGIPFVFRVDLLNSVDGLQSRLLLPSNCEVG